MFRDSTAKGYWDQIRDRIEEGVSALAEHGSSAYRQGAEPMIEALRKQTGYSRDVIERVLGAVTDRGHSAAETAQEGAHDLAHRAHKGVRRGMSLARDRYEGAEGLVRDNPASSVLIAFGIGLLAGAVVMAIRDSRDT